MQRAYLKYSKGSQPERVPVPNLMIILFLITYQALLEVHDAVAFKTYASPPASPGLSNDTGAFNGVGGQPIRMVGLHKQPNKPLVSDTTSKS